jgi:hypothetical protein
MMTDSNNRQELLDNEWHSVRDSGEIPEVAYHSSLYYLTTDDNGPRLQLSDEEIDRLLDAARERYREIVLRDMLPENREKSCYRGLKRSMENWRRFTVFHQRYKVELPALQREAASALQAFLASEIADGLLTSLNCSLQELLAFAHELGLLRQDLPENFEKLFPCNGA